jgi:hypothetical protein
MKLDPSNLLKKPERAVKIHTTLFWGSIVATPICMYFFGQSVALVQLISWYTIWFLHIDGKQAALAHLESAKDKK